MLDITLFVLKLCRKLVIIIDAFRIDSDAKLSEIYDKLIFHQLCRIWGEGVPNLEVADSGSPPDTGGGPEKRQLREMIEMRF